MLPQLLPCGLEVLIQRGKRTIAPRCMASEGGWSIQTGAALRGHNEPLPSRPCARVVRGGWTCARSRRGHNEPLPTRPCARVVRGGWTCARAMSRCLAPPLPAGRGQVSVSAAARHLWPLSTIGRGQVSVSRGSTIATDPRRVSTGEAGVGCGVFALSGRLFRRVDLRILRG